MFKFQNQALYPVISLFFAHLVNDAFTTPIIGKFPITPVQIALILGIMYGVSLRKPNVSRFLKRLYIPMIAYYIVIIASTVYVFINYNTLELYIFTLGFNLLWIVVLTPHLYKGIQAKDTQNLLNSIVFLILLFTVTAGLYEFFTGRNVLTTKYGISTNIFYLRGFHNDKIEFASVLGLAVFCLLIKMELTKSGMTRFILIIGIILCSFLALLSYSTTSILGIFAGSFVIIFYRTRNIFAKVFVSIFLLYSLYSFVMGSQLFHQQLRNYEVKFNLNVQNYEENNFRYLAFVEGFKEIMKEPIIGHGVSRSQYVIQNALNLKKQVNPHNIISAELIDYGIVGFVFISIFFFRFYKILFIKVFPFNRYLCLTSLHKLSLALGLFVLFRLLLYYHRMDQTIYFFWFAIVILFYGSAVKRLKIIRAENYAKKEVIDSGAQTG